MAANNYTECSSGTLVGLWQFDGQNLNDTSGNSNTLTAQGTPDYSNATPPRSDSSYSYHVGLVRSSNEVLYRTENVLSPANFPGKNGWALGSFSVAGCFKVGTEQTDANVGIVSGYLWPWHVMIKKDGSNFYLQAFYVDENPANYVDLVLSSHSIVAGEWYHFGMSFTYNSGGSNTLYLRLYRYSTTTAYTTSTTSTYDIDATTTGAYFQLGRYTNAYYYDGQLEDVSVWYFGASAPFDATDFSQLAAGTYTCGTTTTTTTGAGTTTTAAPTTTTTAAPTTTTAAPTTTTTAAPFVLDNTYYYGTIDSGSDPTGLTPSEIGDLLTVYTSTDINNVASINSIYRATGVATSGDYAVQLFVIETSQNSGDLTAAFTGHSSLDPSSSAVSLYLFNVAEYDANGIGAAWEEVDTESTVGAYEQLTVQYSQSSSQSDYYDDQGGGIYWQYWLVVQQSAV